MFQERRRLHFGLTANGGLLFLKTPAGDEAEQQHRRV
jgi:hypothetical protein